VMLSKIVTSAALQIAGLGLNFFDRLILSAILLRYWGVGVFEDWSLLLAAAGMLNLLDFGLHQTFSNVYTRKFQSGDRAGFTRQMSIALGLMTVVSIAGIAILTLWVASGMLYTTVAIRTVPLGEAATACLLLGLATIVQTAAGVTSPIYRAQDRFSRGLAFELGTGATRLLGTMLVALLGGGMIAVATVYLFATVAMYANVLRDQLSTLVGLTLRPSLPTRAELKTIVVPAAWFYVQHASNVLLLGVPLLVIGHVEVALGGISAFIMLRTLANLARQCCQILANSPAIELSRLWFKHQDLRTTQDLLRRTTRLIAVVAGILVGILLPLIDPIFAAWSGGRVEPRHDVALIFCIGVVLIAPCGLVATFLNYIGDAQIGAYARLLNLLVAASVSIAVVGPLELLGVSLALVLGEAIGFWLIYLPKAQAWIGETKTSLALRWIAYSALGGAPVFVFAQLLLSATSGAATFVLLSISLPIVAAATLFLFGLAAADRSTILNIARTKLGWR
jgi:O-antigen/teichoic acid export membrane protein